MTEYQVIKPHPVIPVFFFYWTILLNATCSIKAWLTHWGRVMHICIGNLIIIGSDNGLSPGRRQAIIWANDGILLIRSLETNYSEILSKIHTFSFKKMLLKTSAKWQPFCLGLNEMPPIWAATLDPALLRQCDATNLSSHPGSCLT